MSGIVKSSIVPVVTVSGDGKPVASSLDVARFFRKAHKNILACIDVIRRNPANRLEFKPIDTSLR